MFTSKILYCYWACLAEDDDNFVLETNKPLPNEDAKKIMREKIIGKSNEEIAQVQLRIISLYDIKRSGSYCFVFKHKSLGATTNKQEREDKELSFQ